MYKYENIKKVLNYIPDGLKEEENEATLIKWALSFYNQNIRIRTITDDILFAICPVTNHKATLPVGFKQFVDVTFNEDLPTDTLTSSSTVFLQPDINGIHTTIFQRTYYQFYKQRSYNTRYVGSNPALVHTDCVQHLCDDCINFSIDKVNEAITVDICDGYIYLLYSSTVMDEQNNFLVPDHPVLWQALAYGVEAKHWQDRAFRKEEGANNMFMERMRMANNSIGEFLKVHVLSNFDPYDYHLKTQAVRQFPQMNQQADFYNYKRV